jgi:hypothetical protein
MTDKTTTMSSEFVQPISREQLIGLLNEDLSREYQAIIAYVVYSQVLKGLHEHRRGIRKRVRRASACIITKLLTTLGACRP